MTSLRTLLLTTLVPLALVACADSESSDAESAAPAVEEAPASVGIDAALEVALSSGVRNARSPLPGILTAGQPTPEQLTALRGAGAEHYISLRPVSEDGAGWEEERAAAEGYSFARLPISGAGSLTRENVETFAALLEEAGDGPTVVYCASSNRVGAMMALKAHWIDGASPEDALTLGREAGLGSLEGPVRELLGLGPAAP